MGTQVLVLHYRYAEEALPGYDIWASVEGYYERPWEALQSLAHFLLQFYLGEMEGRQRPLRDCCLSFQDLQFMPDAKKPKFCPECGRRYPQGDFNVEHFADWIRDVYARPSHELPNFWEYEDEWYNHNEFSVLLNDYEKENFFEVCEYAEEVLAAALDPRQLPANSRDDFKEQVGFWFKRFDDEVQAAYHEYEEAQSEEGKADIPEG